MKLKDYLLNIYRYLGLYYFPLNILTRYSDTIFMVFSLSNVKPASISLCMIAKNEEHCIANAINSVKDLVDEIIVVDTGSTDKTIEIAESLNAKVFNYTWKDDFSEPRNLSISKTTSEWILVLDCDEFIHESSHAKIKELILDKSKCYLMPQRHYSNDQRISNFVPCTGEYKQVEEGHLGFFVSYCCRLFPNNESLKFTGRIHELVEHSIKDNPNYKLIKTEIPIHHYGHTENIKKMKDKTKLYTPLGNQKINDNPNDWKAYFELGVEYNCNGQKKESIEAFKKALELNKDYIPTWTNLGYVFMETGDLNNAHSTLTHALKLDKNNPDANCNIAVVYMRAKKWELAIKHLEYTIKLKKDYLNAYNNLAECYLHLGKPELAEKTYKKILSFSSSNTNAKMKLSVSYFLQKKYAEAKSLLEEIIETNNKESDTYYYLGKVHEALNNSELAITNLKYFTLLEAKKAENVKKDFLIKRVKSDIERIENGV